MHSVMPAEMKVQVAENEARRLEIVNAQDAQLALVVTLTAGSLLKGVLDIYGTTNRLLLVYPAAAAVILAAAAVTAIKNRKIKSLQ